MPYVDIVICVRSLPILETWPPIYRGYRGQERTVRGRLKASQVYTHVYFRCTPCLTDFTFEFIRRPISPILSPLSRTFVELTLVTLLRSYPPIWALRTMGVCLGRGPFGRSSSLLNSIGLSDQLTYFVVAGGKVVARFTCRDMLSALSSTLVHVGSLRQCILWTDVSSIILITWVMLPLGWRGSVGWTRRRRWCVVRYWPRGSCIPLTPCVGLLWAIDFL
jgi:hypothetical protein